MNIYNKKNVMDYTTDSKKTSLISNYTTVNIMPFALKQYSINLPNSFTDFFFNTKLLPIIAIMTHYQDHNDYLNITAGNFTNTQPE